jgi:hypothetical protein
MDAAKTILRQSGIESIDGLAPNECCRVTVVGHDDLVMEKVGPDRLSVAHHTVRGECRVRDPEVVFRVEGGTWVPIECTRRPSIHRYDATGIEMKTFLRQWSERLRENGFLDTKADTRRIIAPGIR